MGVDEPRHTWSNFASEAFSVADKLIKRYSALSLPPSNWTGMSQDVADQRSVKEKKQRIEEIANAFSELLDDTAFEFMIAHSLFYRLQNLLEIAVRKLPPLTLPAHTIDYSWFEGKRLIVVPERQYRFAWDAIVQIEGQISFWTTGAAEAYRESAEIQLAHGLSKQEQMAVEKYELRSVSRPLPKLVCDIISTRLKHDFASVREDLALGVSEDIAPPRFNPAYDYHLPSIKLAVSESRKSDGMNQPQGGMDGAPPSGNLEDPLQIPTGGWKLTTDDRLTLLFKNTPESTGWTAKKIADVFEIDESTIRKCPIWTANRKRISGAKQERTKKHET